MLLTLWISAAFAVPVFPSYLEAELGMPCQPQCTLCHQTTAGGSGTVTQDFGVAMRDRGLDPGADEESLLVAALAQMEADAVDSDGDGIIDVDELREGQNPNPGGADFCSVSTPQYGCFSHAPTISSGLGIAAIVGLVLRRRR